MNDKTADFRGLTLISPERNYSISVGSGAMVVRDGKMLMVRSKEGSSLWKFPGGHLRDYETMGEAAVREVLEETGYHAEVVGKPVVYEFDLNKDLRLVLFFYLANIIGEGTPEEGDEIVEVKWFGLDEIPENCFENVKHVIKYFRESANLS